MNNKQATEIHNRTELDKDLRPMKISLPFPCDTKGFIDPLAEKPVWNGVILRKFSVPDRGAKNPMTDLLVQTKFLILGLEAAQNPMFVKQDTKAKDFTMIKSPPGFTRAHMAVHANESSSSESENGDDGNNDGGRDSNMIDSD
jgi:hypothetical protein